MYCTLVQYMQETVNVLYTCTVYARNSKCTVQYMQETVNVLVQYM